MADLKQAELNKRDSLKREKPYVYEKILKFDEKIKRGESIAIIQFQYNYQCNFRCEHCSVKRFQGKTEKRSFTIADVKENELVLQYSSFTFYHERVKE